MYKLYGRQGTGSDAPRIILEEAGIEYDFVDVSASAQKGDDFSGLNPMQQLPVLMLPSGTVISESGAISLLLADLHPDTGLLPAPESDERAEVTQWMFFAATNLYEDCRRHYHADAYTDPDSEDAVRSAALDCLQRHWSIVERALGDRDTLVADSRTVVDIYLAMLADWTPDRAALWQSCPGVERMCNNVGQMASARTVGVGQA